MKKNQTEQDSQSLNSILEKLRQEYWKNLSETEQEGKQEGVELLTFWLGEEHYGVDLSFSRHLLKLPRIVKLPHAQDWVIGIFNLRGDIVPALDLRRLFGLRLSETGPDSRLLVVEAKGVQSAVLLDRVGDIIFAENKSLQKSTGKESSIPAQFLKGYFLPERLAASSAEREKEKIIIWLDLEQLLGSEKLTAGFGEG